MSSGDRPSEAPKPCRFREGDRVTSTRGAGSGVIDEVVWSDRSHRWIISMRRDEGWKDHWLATAGGEDDFAPGDRSADAPKSDGHPCVRCGMRGGPLTLNQGFLLCTDREDCRERERLAPRCGSCGKRCLPPVPVWHCSDRDCGDSVIGSAEDPVLRRERATDRPKVIWTPNADAGDSTGTCEVCGHEIDAPHTWEECARLSRSFADQATSYTCDLSERVKHLEGALDAIANDPHCSYVTDVPMTEAEGQYRIGVADGHRCAAQKARASLSSGSTTAHDAKENG